MTIEVSETEETPSEPIVLTPGNVKTTRKARLAAIEDEDIGQPPAPAADKPRSAPRRLTESAVVQSINREEDLTIKELLEQLGADGLYKIEVSRKEPDVFRAPNGKVVNTAGHLKTYDHAIDESLIKDRHGGGKYKLVIKRQAADGSYKYFKARVVTIAGDPNLDDPALPQSSSHQALAPAATTTPPENTTMIKEVFGVLRDELGRRNETKPVEVQRGMDPAMLAMFENMMSQLRESIAARDREITELRRDLTAAQNKEPPKDEIKEKLLGSLIDGESGRITSIRVQHDSELRMVKDQAREDEKRLQDRLDRMLSDMKSSHERELTLLRMSHETTLAATKSAHETSTKLLESEVKRLERDNSELREDLKELRAKKEKTILEQVKDIETIKDAFGVGDADEKSTVDKIMEALQTAIEVGKDMFGKKEQPQQPQQPQLPPGMYKMPDGQKVYVRPDGVRVPVRKKPPAPPPPGTPVEPVLPQIDPATTQAAISFLERAYAGNQVPEVVAQSARPMIPPEILQAISEHGVDTFMTKIAKLPGGSPLATQSGKNWVRKLGKSLVGDE